MAAVFPLALAGIINLYLAFRIFLMNYPHWKSAALFTLFYGFSASVWIFSSFPETMLVTTLATNIFILLMLSQVSILSTLPVLAAVNVAAAFASPQQLMLAIIPGVSYLRQALCRTWAEGPPHPENIGLCPHTGGLLSHPQSDGAQDPK